MSKNLRTVALALLCVLAIGVAAATLSSTVDPGDGEGTGSGEEGVGPGSGDEPDLGDSSSTDELQGSGDQQPDQQWEYCYEPLDDQPIYVLLFGVPVTAGLIVSVFTDRRRGFAAAMFIFWPALILVVVLTAGCSPPPSEQAAEEAVNTTQEIASSAGGGGGDDRTFTAPTSLIAILLLVASVGIVAAVLLRRDGEEAAEVSTEPAFDDEQRRAAIGSAAGDAADRIEDDAGLENEVYRAWAEMADPLPVDHPETSTPAEFADAAVDAGIDPDDVRELTGLFEEVRYSTAEATPEREQRAVEALRRIERQYADAAGADGSGAGDRGPNAPPGGDSDA